MNVVRTIGQEVNPAKRLRLRWGAEMRYTRQKLLGWTLDELARRMSQAGYPVTAQAISSWERGETSPRPHHQLGWCQVVGRPHQEVFRVAEVA